MCWSKFDAGDKQVGQKCVAKKEWQKQKRTVLQAVH